MPLHMFRFRVGSNTPVPEAEKTSIETATQLQDLMSGIWKSWMITTAVKLDIANHLKGKPLDTAELAALTGTDPASIFRLMRALQFFDIFKLNENKKWTLGSLGIHLTDNDRFGFRHAALLMVHDEHLVWPNLHKPIKTGQPVIPELYGAPYWEFLSTHPERFYHFRNALGEILTVFCSLIPEVYDFRQFHHIVDIAGNDGTFMTYILKSAPEAKGTILDMEYVRKYAEKKIEENGLADRCKFVGGNFLESLPEGGDCYIMKQAFHDWGDEDALKILTNAAARMTPTSKLLIMQVCLPEDDAIHNPAHVWDIYTFMMVGGKERKQSEYEAMFKKAGLRMNKLITPGEPLPQIMELVLDN